MVRPLVLRTSAADVEKTHRAKVDRFNLFYTLVADFLASPENVNVHWPNRPRIAAAADDANASVLAGPALGESARPTAGQANRQGKPLAGDLSRDGDGSGLQESSNASVAAARSSHDAAANAAAVAQIARIAR